MLDNYFRAGGIDTTERHKRLLAVQAALEIAKASVGNSHAANLSRVGDDLQAVSKEIGNLADAIQAALVK